MNRVGFLIPKKLLFGLIHSLYTAAEKNMMLFVTVALLSASNFDGEMLPYRLDKMEYIFLFVQARRWLQHTVW